MQNPFTTTFSKLPEYTYIVTDSTDEILDNFSYSQPSESVYKITGVRGSGKTVLLAKIEETLKPHGDENDNWIVCDLNPNRDMLSQLAAMLSKEIAPKKELKSIGVNISASVLGTGGGIGVSAEHDNPYFDIGVEIESMIEKVQANSKRILVGIDEVSKTSYMIEFASEFGRWLRAGYPIYLVCTGLFENIQELSNVKNLTFFRRATTIQTRPLNLVRMTEMYKSKLNVDASIAKSLASATMGYAYAFQQLGVLYFNKQDNDSINDVIQALKVELFAYSYEKIWEELTENDKLLISLLTEKSEYKREEILVSLGEKQNIYSMYRDRLLKRGLINARQGYISLSLPFFADYIKEYCQ